MAHDPINYPFINKGHTYINMRRYFISTQEHLAYRAKTGQADSPIQTAGWPSKM